MNDINSIRPHYCVCFKSDSPMTTWSRVTLMITEHPKYHFPKMHTSTVICSYLQVLSHLIGIVCQIYVKYIRTLPLIAQ